MSERREGPLVWVKSSYTDTGNCVEVASPEGSILVRDSKRPRGARVALPPAAWYELVDWVKTH